MRNGIFEASEEPLVDGDSFCDGVDGPGTPSSEMSIARQ